MAFADWLYSLLHREPHYRTVPLHIIWAGQW